MKKIVLIAFVGFATISSVMALSSYNQELPTSKPVVCTPVDQMLTDTVPGTPKKHKKSDTTSYPKQDTSVNR